MPTVLHIFTVPSSLRFVRGLPADLKSRGYAMSVVASPGPALDAFITSERCVGFAVELSRRVTPLQDLAALGRLIRVIRRVRPDIVHAHTPKGGLLGMLAATAAGVSKRIYHMRGLPMATATGASRFMFHITERVSCGLATRVLCVGPSLRQTALQFRLVAPERIAFLCGGSGQGVDTGQEFYPGVVSVEGLSNARRELGLVPGAPVVLFMGRLVRDKGIIDLADAWCDVRRCVPDARLVLVGPYEPRDPVPPDVVDRLRADSTVRHVPWTDAPARYYALANLVVLPTYREGFPNVPLEAAAMGIPVVATRVPGCVDAVDDGRTGTLVPAMSPRELARAIVAYLANPDLARRHGQAGRERVAKHFQRSALWEAMANVYDELLGRQVPPRPPNSGRAS